MSLKKAEVVWEGKTLDACWYDDGDHVDVLDETGDGGAVPKGLFKKADVI